MPLNAAGENALLSGGLSNVAVFLSLHTGNPGTTGTNEAAGGAPAYARKAVTWNAAAAGKITNNGAITFDVPAGTYVAVGLWSLVTAGVFYGWVPIQGASPAAAKLAEVLTADVAADTVQSDAHGFTAGQQVYFYSTEGNALPAGLAAGTAYFVIATGLTANAFKVSLTSGGAAVDITGEGTCFVQLVIPEVFAAQGTEQLTNGNFTLDATLLTS